MSDKEMTQRDDSSSENQGPSGRRFYKYPFLNRKLQFSFAGLLAVIGLGNAIYLSILFYFYSQTTFALLTGYIPEYVDLAGLIDQYLLVFWQTMFWIIIPEILLIVIWGLFFSHRLAGPLFSMTRTLKDIAKGLVPTSVRIRKGDMLIDFADQMNEAIDELQRQRDEIALSLKDLEEGRAKEGQERLDKIIHPKPEPGSS